MIDTVTENGSSLPELLSYPQVMDYLNVSQATLKRMLSDGRLKRVKLGNKNNSPARVTADSLKELMQD